MSHECQYERSKPECLGKHKSSKFDNPKAPPGERKRPKSAACEVSAGEDSESNEVNMNSCRTKPRALATPTPAH